VAILSLRFNPGFLYLLKAYNKAIRALGGEPAFVLDEGYKQFPDLLNCAPIFGSEALGEQDWSHAIILNPSLMNKAAANMLKQRGARILYIFHEPWQMSLSYLRNEGLRDTLKAALAHRMTVPVLAMADTVILASQFALNLYRRVDLKHNPRAAYFPLIYDDDSRNSIEELLPAKQYFSFVGNLCRAHGFDQYVTVMRDALLSGQDMRFLIASRFPLPRAIAEDPVLQGFTDRVEIRCGLPLSDEEINRCYARSFCVWTVYRRSTQSGVLPKAYMFGSPVIASRVGSFPEFVQDGVNGRFADGGDVRGILDRVEDMRASITSYAANCRKTFLDTFFYKARLNDLQHLLDVS
jgi:glycosyltransferase involved in cell wall biosynthesis